MLVRQAWLEDAAAVTEIYCSLVSEWFKITADGSRIRAAYDDLSLYERWQHGGPWFSIETCALWIGHLLQTGDGIPLVAEIDGEVVGGAEVFIAQEAAPYGHHINISTLCVRRDAQGLGVGRALVKYIEAMAAALNCQLVTMAYPNPPAFYEKLDFSPLVVRHHITLPADEGRVFYKARELTDFKAAQVRDWYMPLGRFQNAREEWEQMHWSIWNGVPQLVEAKWHSLFIDLTGQPGILHLHQHDNDPDAAAARLWTKNAVSTHILSAVRDRAARLGYRRVTTIVDADLRPAISDAQDEAAPQSLFAKRMTLAAR